LFSASCFFLAIATTSPYRSNLNTGPAARGFVLCHAIDPAASRRHNFPEGLALCRAKAFFVGLKLLGDGEENW